MKTLVIVESPAKARTLSQILGKSYTIKASLGHIRDLPKFRLGVYPDRDFEPVYEIVKEKKAVVEELRESASGASSVILATDPDREGEAISWHLAQALDLASPRRVVFHELTADAVKAAFRHPKTLDMQLVNAQQARRILDRLIGYKLSPVLKHKVRAGLSAGRVQSVAVRMIVEREQEIEAFTPQEYWSIEAELESQGKPPFRAALVGPLARGRKLQIPNREEAERLSHDLKQCSYAVTDVRQKEQNRQPPPPFTTSTLQQEASRKLGFTGQRTMMIAQQLYEGLPVGGEGTIGLITYMRTDSTRVAAGALQEARAVIAEKYGNEFLPPHPRVFTHKAKGAQEAHEAIRPTSPAREPSRIKSYLNSEQLRLYELIWRRMLASQMAHARIATTAVDIAARGSGPRHGGYLLRATASQVAFPGFLTLYQEGRDEDSEAAAPALPPLEAGEALRLLGLSPDQHFTQPPPRYTEATLVKALEENGIGRPSTYAPTISTIQLRGYVRREKGRFQPTHLGRAVNGLLVEHFGDIVDVGFTAQMETELDDIAQGKREWVPVLAEFYPSFAEKVEIAHQAPRVQLPEEVTDEKCEKCGRPMVIKEGRFGRFLACSGYPECVNRRSLKVKAGVPCPRCGGDLLQRRSKKGRTFFGCGNYPKCNFTVFTRPLPQPCPKCKGLLVPAGKQAKCVQCDYRGKVPARSEEKVAAS